MFLIYGIAIGANVVSYDEKGKFKRKTLWLGALKGRLLIYTPGLIGPLDCKNPNLDNISHHSILKTYPRAIHSPAFLNTIS